MAALNTCYASISDFSSPVSVSTLANDFLVLQLQVVGSVQRLPARILLQLFAPQGHPFAREKAHTPPKMLVGYCAAQLYEQQDKCLHLFLVTFNYWNCPLHCFDLGQPKQCFKETWRAPELGSMSITQSASGHAALEVRTA